MSEKQERILAISQKFNKSYIVAEAMHADEKAGRIVIDVEAGTITETRKGKK